MTSKFLTDRNFIIDPTPDLTHRIPIYVAGPSREPHITEIETFIHALESSGKFTITEEDWTKAVRTAGGVGSPDDPGIRRTAATADLAGVEHASIVWVLQLEETSTSTGAWVELGYALGLRDLDIPYHRTPTIIVSGASRNCIFADLADYRFLDHKDALAFLVGDFHELFLELIQVWQARTGSSQ